MSIMNILRNAVLPTEKKNSLNFFIGGEQRSIFNDAGLEIDIAHDIDLQSVTDKLANWLEFVEDDGQARFYGIEDVGEAEAEYLQLKHTDDQGREAGFTFTGDELDVAWNSRIHKFDRQELRALLQQKLGPKTMNLKYEPIEP